MVERGIVSLYTRLYILKVTYLLQLESNSIMSSASCNCFLDAPVTSGLTTDFSGVPRGYLQEGESEFKCLEGSRQSSLPIVLDKAAGARPPLTT